MKQTLLVRKPVQEEIEVEFDLIKESGAIKLIRTKPKGGCGVLLHITAEDSGGIRIDKASCFNPQDSGIEVDEIGRIIIRDI